jgi:hypothetical protein
MTPRELVRRTLRFDSPSRVPRHAWITPWAEQQFPDAVARLRAEFPDDIVTAPALYRDPPPIVGHPHKAGVYVDEWGCRFENPYDGLLGLVRDPVIAEWRDADGYRTPDRLLAVDVRSVDAFCDATDRFVLAGTLVRPFERLGFLRTLPRALADLLEPSPQCLDLLDRIARHYVREIEAWGATRVDAVVIMDDWGERDRLLVSPETWRRVFKPIYREFCQAAHRAGQFVFMHSDGFILDIVADLIDIGVDALNSQIGCMSAPALGRFRGHLTFWGEIDRHAVLSNGSLADVRRAVEEAHRHLSANGGVIAQCEFGPGARPENVLEVFRSWGAMNPAG